MMNFLGNPLESFSESTAAAVSDTSGRVPTNGQQFRNDHHTKDAFALMNQLRRNRIMCDVSLVAEGVEIPVHKLVMASVSPYFTAMFGGKMSECRADRVKLNGVHGDALKELVEYVYTSQIEITEENVQHLLPAASLLELSYVRESCCLFLQSQLHPSNCLGIRQFADVHSCKDLLDQAKTFSEQHFTDVVNGKCTIFDTALALK